MNEWVEMQKQIDARRRQRKQDLSVGVAMFVAAMILSGIYVLLVKIAGGW